MWTTYRPAGAAASAAAGRDAATPTAQCRARVIGSAILTRMVEQSARKSGCLYTHERAEVSMAGSYSTEPRERVLAAVGAGATPEAAARRVAVGRSTAYRWARE